MKNLVEQASLWLKSDKCLNGSIVERTNHVVRCFRSYVESEQEEIIKETNLSLSIILDKVDTTAKTILKILSSYLRGNHYDALKMTRDLLRSMKYSQASTNIPLYKCRENGRMVHFTKDEMFHVPYNKRGFTGNQRFSLAGSPCLYLGGSSYICWEELGRKDLSTCNYCGYSLLDSINMFDLMLPVAIKDRHQIRKTVLALASSLTAKREDLFKPEYILPQCILHSLIYRSYYSHQLFCIRYYSSHLFKGDADYFNVDFSKEDQLSRYVNYVFPAPSSIEDGYNDKLRDGFKQTETISLMHETILDPSLLMGACSNDVYLDSQFGLIDSILDQKLGFESKRKEGCFLIV